MASKQKRGAPEEEATGCSPKRKGAIGDEGPSKISGRGELGIDQGKVNGEGSFEMEVLGQVEGEGDFQNGHPLLIPLILETVLQYTGTLEEVKRNRTVCRTWRNAAEPQWTTLTKTLTLFRNETPSQGTEIPSDEVISTLQQLREMCRGTKSALEKVVLYRKFKFQDWSFDADLLQVLNTINEPITTDRWFWNRIAPSLIKSLTLENCRFPVRFMPFEESVLKSLPNLESLSVINCTTTLDILNSAFPVWMNALVGPIEEEVDPGATQPYKHPNLKYVHLNVSRQWDQLKQAFSLLVFLRLISSLEGFQIEGVDPILDASILRLIVLQMVLCSVNPGLRKLHLLDFATKTYNRGLFHNAEYADFLFNNLEELHYDIGYGPEAEQEMVFIQNNMPALEKLHLYKAPLSQPLPNFLEHRNMNTVTQLYLWGNISRSFGFLNAFPNLRVLKWVTGCYEEKFHGHRVTAVLEESEQLSTYPLLLRDLIRPSEEVNTLEHLTTFELDCGPISGTSWKRLGEWMPNLKNLKGVVSRVEHFGIIREQWKQLETLELAHGSKLPGGKLLKELTKFEGSLKAFQWKGCACTRKLFGKGVVKGLQETEKKLGSQLPEKCTFPWNTNLERDEATVCKHAVFDITLMSKSVSSM